MPYFLFSTFFLIISYFAYASYLKGALVIAFFAFLFLIIYTIVYTSKKVPLAYRFLFPSLAVIIVCLFIPIVYTLYISMKNFNTQHLLPKSDVLTILSKETFSPPGQKMTFQLMESEDQRDYILRFSKSGSYDYIKIKKDDLEVLNQEKEFKLLKDLDVSGSFKMLQKRDFVKLKDHIGFIRFKNNNRLYQLSGLFSFNVVKKRYTFTNNSNGLTTVFDQEKKCNYYENHDLGKFVTTSGETLAPYFSSFVFLRNYLEIFSDNLLFRPFLKIFSWNIIWAFLNVFISFFIGLFLSIILISKKIKIYRIILLIPYALPVFISVLIWKGFFHYDFGEINQIFYRLFDVKFPWLEDPLFAKGTVIFLSCWLTFPYFMLVTLGALQSIPQDIYSASKIDGATSWMNFKWITLPLVLRSMFPLLIGSFAFTFNNFNVIYLLTEGNPPMTDASTLAGSTDILLSYTYKLAFSGHGNSNYSLAASFSVIIFVITVSITLLNIKASRSSLKI